MKPLLLFLLATAAHADYLPLPSEEQEQIEQNFRSLDENLLRQDLTGGGTVDGQITTTGSTTVQGDLLINGNLQVDGNAVFSSTTSQVANSTWAFITGEWTGVAGAVQCVAGSTATLAMNGGMVYSTWSCGVHSSFGANNNIGFYLLNDNEEL